MLLLVFTNNVDFIVFCGLALIVHSIGCNTPNPNRSTHMHKRYPIQVRKYAPNVYHASSRDFTVVETIKRVLRAEQIGNFNPLFCRYANNPRVLVHSDEGDLSDPFRRDETYSRSFYILAP